ncbi:MAG: right-handed parallel beta-helix repeat-containing protein [Limisphaerales bacterium]
MQKILSLMALLAILSSVETQARTLVLTIATNGNDSWSGELSIPSPARGDGPLRSLAGAISRAREARQRSPGIEGVTILARQGTYLLSEPLVLEAGDSGSSATHPFTIASYPNERATFSGAQPVTGWKRVEGQPGRWQAEVPEVKQGKWYFRQLFINGQRKRRARTPNEGYLQIQGNSPQAQPVQIKFKPGEIQPAWATDGEVEVVALLAWADLRMQIRSVDTNQQLAVLSGNPRPSNRENNARYYIENSPDALDQPGEWYLDRNSGIVTYWANPNEDLQRAEVVAPRLRELLVIQGDTTRKEPVRNLVLRGLTFAHTDWDLGPQGYADTQAAIGIRGSIRVEAAIDSVIEDCAFSKLAGYGLELGRGCQRIKVVGNEFTDLGAGGIRLGETEPRTEAFDLCQGHVITDNHLFNLGVIYPAGVGIFILQSGNNRVAHNHIHDLYYTAISAGWNWGYQETPCQNNIIEFNYLHDIGKGMLSDMGAVYTLGIQNGTAIRNNLIHDVSAFTYGGWGLYTDEGSTGILLENNLVFRCKSAGFHQHYGRDNVVKNNIFAFNLEHQLMRSRDEEHVSFVFTNNIVYFDSGNLLGSTWKNDQFKIDGNVYYDSRPEARPDTMTFAGATFAAWQKRGHDTSSIIADPLFVNPSRLNFRLNPSSPAFKLGFKPIDLSRVGIRPKRQRW